MKPREQSIVENYITSLRNQIKHLVLCASVYTAILLFLALYRQNDPYFYLSLWWFGVFGYLSMAMWLVMTVIAYRNEKKWVGLPGDICASCGRKITPTERLPVCEKCFIDARMIQYGLWKGVVPLTDAGMYLTEHIEPERRVRWDVAFEWANTWMDALGMWIAHIPWILVVLVDVVFLADWCYPYWIAILILMAAFIFGAGLTNTAMFMWDRGFPDVRAEEILLKAHHWRKEAKERIERAAEMLGITPNEAARKCFS